MRLATLILLIVTTSFSDVYFFDPGDELSIKFDAELKSGDEFLITVDNFTMFLPEFITTDNEYNLLALNYGIFKANIESDYSGVANLSGLALYGNSDSCQIEIKLIKNRNDTSLVKSITLKNLDTSSINKYLRFSEINKVYPVPAFPNQEINIEYINDYSTYVDCTLYDLSGKELRTFRFEDLEPGLNKLSFLVPEDPLNNLFFIILEDLHNTLYSKIVIIN